jgi:hypothetical protein
MRVEIITSDNSPNMLAQLCEPQVEIGSNYNLTGSDVDLELTSSLDTSQVKSFKPLLNSFEGICKII